MQKSLGDEHSYIAFISYRHQAFDSKIAIRVQKKIENYIIPKEYRDHTGAKKMGRCFRDEDELAASSSLTDSIYNALDNSEYLIVICTPDLPDSKWCEEEIKYFLKTHDKNHILAVLADGEPSESFSPYMMHGFDEDGNCIASWEPVAANVSGENHKINNKQFNKEMVRLYATMLGCSFDALWQREKREHIKQMLAVTYIAVAILCVFVGVVLNRNRLINRQLSTALVENGITSLQMHDRDGALRSGLSAIESGDASIYDPRSEKLLADALGAYHSQELQCTVVYKQSTDISHIYTIDEEYIILLDSIGVIRCLDFANYDVLWEWITGDSKTMLYTENLHDRIMYKNNRGLYCLSIADGQLLWSYEHPEYCDNAFQAISEDGTVFALLDCMNPENYLESGLDALCFIDTDNGRLLGACDLGFTDNVKIGYLNDSISKCAGTFSEDKSTFFALIPCLLNEGGFKDYYRIYKVDLGSFTANLIKEAPGIFEKVCGFEINPEDDSVFFAGIFSKPSALYTSILDAKEDNSYEVLYEESFTHRIRGSVGVGESEDELNTGNSDILSNKGRVYIFSDDEIFIFDWNNMELLKEFSYSGRIINNYWIDKNSNLMEVVCSNGYFIDYTLSSEEYVILENMDADQIDLRNLKWVCQINGGFLNNPSGGFVLAISADDPGALLLVKYSSDPHYTNTDLQIAYNYESGFIFSPDVDNGVFFHNQKEVSVFDRKTGEIRKAVKLGDASIGYDTVLLNDESLLDGEKVYHLDGASEYYAEPYCDEVSDYYPSYNRRLNNGDILSWNHGTICFDVEEIDASRFSASYPALYTLWLNGEVISGGNLPDNRLLFFEDYNDNRVTIETGESGLVMTYGRAISYDGETLKIDDEPSFQFVNALTHKSMQMLNPYPDAGNFITAISKKEIEAALVYEDGTVCIIEPETEKIKVSRNKWLGSEIIAACFSTDDKYLILLTAMGRVSILDTENMDLVYDETGRLFSELIKYYSYATPGLYVYTLPDRDSVMICIEYLETYAMLINTKKMTTTAEIGKITSYDPENEIIWTSTDTTNTYCFYPVYDIRALKRWAEESIDNS